MQSFPSAYDSQYASRLYGTNGSISNKDGEGEDQEQEGGIEAEIQREVENMKKPPAAELLFTPVQLDTPCRQSRRSLKLSSIRTDCVQ